MGQKRTWTWGLTGLTLFAAGLLPNCSCDEDRGPQKIPVEMRLTLIEEDPCSGAAVPRRVPDDYVENSLPQLTDFGSRAVRRFEVRSIGTAPLTLESVTLSEEDGEFTLTLTDADGEPVTLPREIPADASPTARPGVIIEVAFQAEDAEADLVNLLIKSDDSDRENIEFGLSAGNGKLQVCSVAADGTENCEMPGIAFGNVSRGETAEPQKLVLKNVGQGDLDIRSIKLETNTFEFCTPEATEIPPRDGNVPACDLMNLCKVLKPNESYTVTVNYTPVDGGQDSGNINIVSGDAGLGPVDVPINGTGAGPAVCVCAVEASGDCTPAATIDFGLADVGVGVERTVRLLSCGTEPVDITEADLETMQQPFVSDPEFSITTAFSIGTIDPGNYAEGVIQFLPTAAGDRRGALRYTFSQAALKNWVVLTGKAATCDIEVLPASVSFGVVGGGQSSRRNVLIANNGAKDCEVSAISDPANGFAILNKPALPLTVVAGDSFSLEVEYTAPPRQTPQTDQSSFTVTSNEPAPGDVNTVDLVADGGGAAVCEVTVNPSGVSLTRDGTLQFGAVNIGYSKTLGIQITNSGTANCRLETWRLQTQAPGEITAAAMAPVDFGPGQAARIDVTVSPTQGTGGLLPIYGSLLNYVDFTLSGPGLAQPDWSIGIVAQPTIPSIDIIPADVDFGLVTWENPQAPDNRSSCGSEERSVRIYNSGNGPLDITRIAIDPSSDPVFLISRVNGPNGQPASAPYAMSIPAGQNAEVWVRFFPTRLNPATHQGLIAVENNVTMLSTVPLTGEATANSNQTDVFSQLQDNKIDVLWVVDDSGSMGEEQNSLANNFSSFIGFADSLGVDYQIGVITTEVNDAPAGKIWGCNGFNKIITGSDPNRIAAFDCASRVTNPPMGNSRPNSGGSDEQEAGLQAARIALDAPVRDAENAGFLRTDARLAIITVSDEEDQSDGSVNLYVDFFRNIKGFRNPQLVSLSAIAGDVPSGCATAEAANRYYDAANQLGGQFESICTSSWQNMLQNIGLGVFALRTAWSLSRPADQSSITVRVDGVIVAQDASNGWSFDSNTNSVDFNGSAVPPPGASVEIQYGAVCLQ